MDNLTHTAIGLFLSRIGLGRWSPGATPIVLIAANIPDIDVVSSAGGALNYLAYHRHLTHSLLLMPVMALAAVVVVRVAGAAAGKVGGGIFRRADWRSFTPGAGLDEHLRHPAAAALFEPMAAPGVKLRQ